MRILVFCGTRKALEKFEAQPDWEVMLPISDKDFLQSQIAKFQDDPNAKLAVTQGWALGWRAPADTAVLFDPSWPHLMTDAWSLQAIGRVGL